MFGGFDGDFFNDLHALHLNSLRKNQIVVAPSTLDSDLARIVDDKELSNIVLSLSYSNEILNVNKSVLLYRLFEREVMLIAQRPDNYALKSMQMMSKNMHEIFKCPQTAFNLPDFLT